MFGSRFWAARYWGARYWAATGADSVVANPQEPEAFPAIDVLISWPPPAARGVVATAILRVLDSAGGVSELARVEGGEYVVEGVVPGDQLRLYLAPVYEGGALAPRDDWTYHVVDTLSGTAAPALPAAPVGLGVAQENGQLLFEWNPPADGETVSWELRRGPSWAEGIVVGERLRDPHYVAPWWFSGAQRYELRAVDALGRYSLAGAEVEITVDPMPYFRDATEWQEEADGGGWAGTLEEVEDDGSGNLQLRAVEAWDDEDAAWDEAPWPWNGKYVGTGTYTAPARDLGQVEAERFEVEVGATYAQPTIAWDDPILAGVPYRPVAEDLGGSALPLGYRGWGHLTTQDLTPLAPLWLLVQVRTTDDDPAGTPTWSAWRRFVPGVYSCRGVQFRVHLWGDGIRSPVIERLRIKHRRLNKKDEGHVTVLGTNPDALAVTFTTPFRVAPEVAWTVDGGDGRRCLVENVTATGFDLRCYDAAGSELFSGDDPGTIRWGALGV